MFRERPNPPNNNVRIILFFTFVFSLIFCIHISSIHNTFSSFSAPLDAKDPCSRKYIFIQDIPSKFNYDVLVDCEQILPGRNMCISVQNDGFGPPMFDTQTINVQEFDMDSWFDTNQFMLELIFHKRMKEYRCLTKNSTLANAVFVPFYTGLDVMRTLWEHNTTVRDKVGLEFLEYISSSEEWKRMYGRDHFIIGGRIGWEFRRLGSNGSNWGSSLMSQPRSKHMTMLTIEASNFKNEVGIPYPTYFHPSSREQIRKWQEYLQLTKRGFLFAFAGAPRPNQPIRNELFSQCSVDKDECALLTCSDTYDPKCHQPLNLLRIFQNATFCLQPPGDSPTRRSTFDSIISGCIPVFFRMESGPNQYLWHFPRNYSSYSVYIPEEDVLNKKVDVKKILSSISSEEVKAMRNEVIKMIPRVIYRNGGNEVGTREMEMDAFDLAVEGILKRVENIKREYFSGNESGLYF